MPLPIATQSVEAVGLEVEREAGAGLRHLYYLGIYIEADGSIERHFLISFAKLEAAILRKGLNINTFGPEASVGYA